MAESWVLDTYGGKVGVLVQIAKWAMSLEAEALRVGEVNIRKIGLAAHHGVDHNALACVMYSVR